MRGWWLTRICFIFLSSCSTSFICLPLSIIKFKRSKSWLYCEILFSILLAKVAGWHNSFQFLAKLLKACNLHPSTYQFPSLDNIKPQTSIFGAFVVYVLSSMQVDMQSARAVTPRTLLHARWLVSCLLCKRREDFDACPATRCLVMWAKTYSKEVLMDNASPPQLATLSNDYYCKDGSFASHTGIDCGGCSSTSWCDTENEAWIKRIDFVSQGRKEGWS